MKAMLILFAFLVIVFSLIFCEVITIALGYGLMFLLEELGVLTPDRGVSLVILTAMVMIIVFPIAIVLARSLVKKYLAPIWEKQF